jgi:phospholipid/cholesterol/gamma-HCH transport system ATP-binding protein
VNREPGSGQPEIDKPARSGDSGEGKPVEDTPLSEARTPTLGAKASVNDTPGNRPEVGSDDDLAIVVRGLMSQFGEQIVHQNLDLDVRRGEILGVVGGSGTGKSVLMRSILGLNRPRAGTITVFGTDAQSEDENARRRIELNSGVLFQDGALFSSLTVAENVAVPLKEHHKEIDEELRDHLVRLKIRLAGLPDDAADKLPSQLSGGMRKRAGLARALSLDPDLLFLDEPTAGLDPIGAAAFDQLILTLQQALGFTVFLITHDLDTLYAICNRIAVLADKRVLINAPISQVEKFDHPWVQEYFHGPRGRAAQRAIGESGA